MVINFAYGDVYQHTDFPPWSGYTWSVIEGAPPVPFVVLSICAQLNRIKTMKRKVYYKRFMILLIGILLQLFTKGV